MADISQTPANVKIISGSFAAGTAGETLVQGEPIYIDSSGNSMKTQCDGTAAQAVVKGIALTPATVGGVVIYALPGSVVNLGATLAVGETYVVSTAFGKIAPIGDLVSTNYSTSLGPAQTANNLLFSPVVSGTPKA
jgi:hypothetical protein